MMSTAFQIINTLTMGDYKMKNFILIFLLSFSSAALGGFSEIDLVVREALDKEYLDGETCPDFNLDYFDFHILKTETEECFMEIVAQVRLSSCSDSSNDAPVVEALVCVHKEGSGYTAEFLYDWRPE